VYYVDLWPDGFHARIHRQERKLCLLVLVGVRADGCKELVALANGYRESVESWANLMRDAAWRGMCALVLAVGDGAFGFWSALREVSPRRGSIADGSTSASVLGALPSRRVPGWRRRRPSREGATRARALEVLRRMR
jgi:hypothetical protein